MRIATDASAYVYVSHGAAGPVVTLRDRLGIDHRLGLGQDARWSGLDEVWWRPQDLGGLWRARAADGWKAVRTNHTSGNSLAAAPLSATAVHRTDPVRVIENDGIVYPGLAWPVYSDAGVLLAALAPDQPHAHMQSAVLISAAGRRTLHEGAVTEGTSGTDFRMAGTTLCFREASGRVYGIADVGNPVLRPELLARPGEGVTHAVPLYAAGLGLYVLHVRDTGQGEPAVCLTSWASMLSSTPTGWVVGHSTGSGYDHDVRMIPGTSGRALVVWLSPDGRAQERVIDLLVGAAPLPLPVPPPKATKPSGTKALGYFFDVGRYGTFAPARNCTIVGSDLWAAGDGTLPADIKDRMAAAIDACGRAFLAAEDIDVWQPVDERWDKILGVYVHEPSTPDQCEVAVLTAKAAMDDAELPRRPVLAIVGPQAALDRRFSAVCDILAPEVYFDRPEPSYAAQLAVARQRIADVCAAHAPRPLLLVIQAYDRADPAWKARPDALQALQQAANEALARPQVVGLWWFAYARPGGVTTYPDLAGWHAAQVAATVPPPLPVDPIPPDPEPPPMNITLVGPPQDQTKLSLATLREFCQTYEFPAGTKPYANEEIHEKVTTASGRVLEGLFCSDGLYYFMLETWAPIMMDPDDTSTWDQKRQRADAALQSYMKRRLGDTGGGASTFSGPVGTEGERFTQPE